MLFVGEAGYASRRPEGHARSTEPQRTMATFKVLAMPQIPNSHTFDPHLADLTWTASDSLPLTPTQHGMLYHQLAEYRPGTDIEQLIGDLSEDIDASAMETAWASVVKANESLRHAFEWDGTREAYVRRERSEPTIDWEFLDWSSLATAEATLLFAALAQSERTRPFNLQASPLHRVRLAKLAAEHYRLLITFPHLIADGRSFSIILRQLFGAYERVLRHENPEVLSPTVAAPHLKWLGDQSSGAAETFWSSYLKGSAPVAGFAHASLDDANEPHRVEWRSLDPDITMSLKALANANGQSVHTVVQACWGLLLARWSGKSDATFGLVQSGRYAPIPELTDAVGNFINTVPVRVQVADADPFLSLAGAIRSNQLAARPHAWAPLNDILRWSGHTPGALLFESVLILDHEYIGTTMANLGEAWQGRAFDHYEETSYPVAVYAYAEDSLRLRLVFDASRVDDSTARIVSDQLVQLLETVAQQPSTRVGDIDVISKLERAALQEWNSTERLYDRHRIEHLFHRQVLASPDRVALIAGDASLSYEELNELASRCAGRLLADGVAPGDLVGIALPRSAELVVAVLGTLKAGAAYVPLDPEYPAERLDFMVEDASVGLVLFSEAAGGHPLSGSIRSINIDDLTSWPVEGRLPAFENADANAYVIYTSGSTGKPKGVMVRHRNVANFFVGMDEFVTHDPAGTWLAVTSLSFDISVLELLYTLTRGFTVVVHDNGLGTKKSSAMEFGLCYFGSSETSDAATTYRLMLEGARFADRNGFSAIWTPERHFHDFGGAFPNPAVTGAAIAAVTENIAIRAGSCVPALHSPFRIAEEWAVVDNISAGRVGVSFASGWQPRDFVLNPDGYDTARQDLSSLVSRVQSLWRGEAIETELPTGEHLPIQTLPRPVQKELPTWITSAGNAETFELAGRIGANLLTHMLGQDFGELKTNIERYRNARASAGFDPKEGTVSLMLHTFVSDESTDVRNIVREPLKTYLGRSVSLIRNWAWSFPAFKATKEDGDIFSGLTAEEMDALLEHAFDRYYETAGLFGTPESCIERVRELQEIGVNEIACLVDFGASPALVQQNFEHLARLKALATEASQPAPDLSISGLIERHGVTHLQCTPSLMQMLLTDEDNERAIAGLQQVLLGGEALPRTLAESLVARLDSGELLNMYGPTETTIWSTVHRVDHVDGELPIGRPIANTTIFIVDDQLRQVPVGAIGELCIGGEGVAAGYLGRPELTNERFVPVSPGSTEVMYRTGDLARFRGDGTIEFKGRVDQQVKIRGHRIEPGEIEWVITQYDSVSEAVVVAAESAVGAGDYRLFGFVTVQPDMTLDAESLRRSLAAKLPGHMVPSSIAVLDALPKTPNGKTDRKSLTEIARAPREKSSAAPETDRPVQIALDPVVPEQAVDLPTNGALADARNRIRTVWCEILSLEYVGDDDNFFEVGGDSLLAVKLHRKLLDIFGTGLTLTDQFRFPTIASLSTHLGASQKTPVLNRSADTVTTSRPTLDGKSAAARRLEARRRM